MEASRLRIRLKNLQTLISLLCVFRISCKTEKITIKCFTNLKISFDREKKRFLFSVLPHNLFFINYLPKFWKEAFFNVVGEEYRKKIKINYLQFSRKKCSVINQMESLRKGNTFTKMFSPLTIFKTHYNHFFRLFVNLLVNIRKAKTTFPVHCIKKGVTETFYPQNLLFLSIDFSQSNFGWKESIKVIFHFLLSCTQYI